MFLQPEWQCIGCYFVASGRKTGRSFVNNVTDTATVVVHEEKVMETTLSGFLKWVAVCLLNELEGVYCQCVC